MTFIRVRMGCELRRKWGWQARCLFNAALMFCCFFFPKDTKAPFVHIEHNRSVIAGNQIPMDNTERALFFPFHFKQRN